MHSLATTRQFWASVFVEGLSKNVDRRDVSESSTEYQRRVFEFKERIENLAVAKFGDRYAFFNEAVNSSYLTYDADAQIIWLGRRPYDSFFNAFPLSSTETTDHLTIRLMREVLKSGTYIGSNAFGATRVVRQDTIAVSAIRAKLPIATAISSPYSIPRGLTISDNQRITFGLPEISLSRSDFGNLSTKLVVFGALDISDDFTFSSNISRFEPTLRDPFDTTGLSYTLGARLVCFGVAETDAGRVLWSWP